jgi:N-acyl-D-aspartate/D-glutamate deacylase
MLDVLIEGASFADGSGAPATTQPIGIVDGLFRINGDLRGLLAKRRIDATGLVAAPGFVDIHTQFDAQVFWGAYLTPSSLHGVTTVIGGNCGYSVAPLAPGGDEYLQKMLSRVEGIPLPTLRHGVPWHWTSFGDYLAAVE